VAALSDSPERELTCDLAGWLVELWGFEAQISFMPCGFCVDLGREESDGEPSTSSNALMTSGAVCLRLNMLAPRTGSRTPARQGALVM